MILYIVILLPVAALFAVLAVWIYRGRTDLIHDYHQNKVTDKAGYGKAFGKAMAVIAAGMALSGVIALLGENWMWLSMVALFVGLVAGIAAIVAVQKKYNGGVF